MKGGKLLYLTMNIILLVVFLGLIKSIFNITGDLFIFEIIVLVFLLIMALDSMTHISKGNKTGTGVLSILFAILLVNEIGLNLFAKTNLNITIIIFSALGFIITILNSSDEEKKQIVKEIKQPVVEEIMPVKKEEIIEEYYPGKFLSSKTGKKYHIPKCDFAKKIPKQRQIWFDEKKEATKKGYKPCKCIKK